VLLPPGREKSKSDYRVARAFLRGTVSGALVTAITAWVLSGFLAPVPQRARLIILAFAAAMVWLAKEGPLKGRIHLPEAKRQIPAEVFGYGLLQGAYRFGFELGTGVRTYLPSPAPYVVALVVLLGDVTLGGALLIGLGYGLGRAMPLMAQITTAGRAGITARFLLGKVRFAPALASLLVAAGAVVLAR
jgi:hypothetical protein